MDLSSQPSQEGETQDRIIIKLKKHFEDSVDLQKFNYYVQPLAEANSNSQDSLYLLTEVNNFVASEHQCSLLILGDSGNGKSLLGQYVVWQLWKEYKADSIIPIFIHLPLIPPGHRAQKLLKSYLKSAGLNEEERTQLVEKNKLLLVLDGYDEIPEIGNLYKQNHWEKLKIKMMTTCRPEALLQRQTGNSYQELFMPKGTETYTSQDRFVEFRLKKFSLEQIDEYLKQYLSHCKDPHAEDWEIYKQNLNAIPGMLDLVATPFILSIVVQVLPLMIQNYQNQELHEQRKLVRADIYDCFVDDWFDFQVERFREQGKLHSIKGDLKQYLKIYSQNLAYKALSQGRLEIAIEEQETLNPELLRPKDQNLFPQYSLDLPQFTDEAMRYIRSGCLLKTGQNYFSFLHKSLIEYFAAQDLFTGIHLSAEFYTQQILQVEKLNKSLGLNENLLMSEPEIIKILADRVETDALFKQLLYDVVEFSKRQPLVEIAAANAITILNVAGESFSGKNFSHIRIPKANLSGAICDQTDFSDADLSGVCFHHAWLKGSNFSNAQMSDIDFAELPGIENSDLITSFCIASDGKYLLIGDVYGKLSKWCLASGKMEWKESVSACGAGSKLVSFSVLPIYGLAISPDGKKVAMHASDGAVHLWDLAKRKETSSFVAGEIGFCDDADHILNIQFCPPDSKRLIFSGKKTDVQVWDIEIHLRLQLIPRPPRSIFALSSNEEFFISCESSSYSDSNSLLFYDSTTLSLQSTQEINQKYEYGCFSPSGKYFGAVVGKFQIQLLNLTNRKNTKTFEIKGIEFRRLFFSPDEYLIIAVSNDKFYFWQIDSAIFLYDLVLPIQYSERFIFSSFENKLLFSPVNPRHLFYSTENKIYAWCIQTAPSPLSRRLSQFQAYDLQEDEKYFRKEEVKSSFTSVILGTKRLKVDIYLNGFEECHLEVITAERNNDFSLKFKRKQPDGFRFIFSLSLNHRYLALSILPKDWDENDFFRKKTFPLLSAIIGFVERMTHDTDIRVFDLEKDQLIHTFSHANPINSMRFSSDNEWLVTAADTVRIWNLQSGKCLHKYSEHKAETTAVALTSDKKFLAISENARSVSIYDTSTHKSVFLVSQLPFNTHRMLFIKNDNFFLCQTKEKDQLLFKFHYDGEKAHLNLIESSKNFSFNPFEVNLRGAYGLSSENQRLLHQKGAFGKPSECSVKPQSKNSLFQILKFNSALQPVVKQRAESIVSSKAPILYDNWIISLLRKPSGKVPEHVFLLIEGLDQFGKGILGRIELVNNKKKDGYALIVEKCLHDIPPNELKDAFLKEIVEHDKVYSLSWSLPRSKVQLLIEDIEKDKEKEFKYAYLGNNSIFVKSSSVDGHNCFTWVRQKLLNLDEEKIQRDLKEKWTDCIATKPSYYLLPNK